MRVSLLLILFACSVYPTLSRAGSFALNGNLEYQDSDDAVSQFSQRYGVDFNKQVDVTELMRMNVGMRYNQDIQPDNTREDLNPSLSYDITNEIFDFNIAGNANQQRNSSSSGTNNRNWTANLNSAWLASGIRPVVSVNFNQSWQNDDLDPHISDSDSTNSGCSLAWGNSEDPMRVFYSYNWQKNANHTAGSNSRSDSHFVKAEGGRSFWDNRGNLTISQQYTYTKNKNYSQVDAGTGIALVQIPMSAYSGEIDPAANVSLTSNTALTNNNKTDTAVTVNNPGDPNQLAIGMKPNSQTVSILYLYTDVSLSTAVSNQFTWDLYYSNDNTHWTLAKTGLSSVYSIANHRFVIDISGYQRNFLRVVAVDDPTTAVNFSEIEVYKQVSSTDNIAEVVSDHTNWTTEANLSLQLKQNLILTSNLSYIKDISSSGSGQQKSNIGVGVSWDPDYYLSVQLNGSLNNNASDNADTSQTRTYSLLLSSPILPTVDTSFGTTISQYMEGGDIITNSYNYNLQMIAAIYHDLDARVNASYAQVDNKRDSTSSNTKTTGLVLTARLFPGLTADFSGTYSKTSGQSDSIVTITSAHWRLSEELSVNSSYSQAWASSNSSSALLSLSWAMTNNMQVSLSHKYTINPGGSHLTSLDWRWAINRYMSLSTSGTFNSSPSAWAVNSRLNARFTTM